jgi:hypothetical protein
MGITQRPAASNLRQYPCRLPDPCSFTVASLVCDFLRKFPSSVHFSFSPRIRGLWKAEERMRALFVDRKYWYLLLSIKITHLSHLKNVACLNTKEPMAFSRASRMWVYLLHGSRGGSSLAPSRLAYARTIFQFSFKAYALLESMVLSTGSGHPTPNIDRHFL